VAGRAEERGRRALGVGLVFPEELESRFKAIERFMAWEIPATIWVVTDPGWDNGPVLDRALELVGPEHIVEEPIAWGWAASGRPSCEPTPPDRARRTGWTAEARAGPRAR